MSHQGYIDHTSGKPVFLGVVGIGVMAVICFLLVDGFVRALASEPQMWETHVRYTWQDKARKQHCVIAIRGKVSEPCGKYTKAEIETFRLQTEKPTPRILAGKF